uniref:hypothetical protein RF2 n=1 Tax=Prosopanche panguanensis TaxID=2952649 RepID=UPI0021145A2F|nr:hypothetical protein RF2 [Prosopanche panguanensis]USN93713.1 hypothetical protein RF2 [Prosopanche panguanensis]
MVNIIKNYSYNNLIFRQKSKKYKIFYKCGNMVYNTHTKIKEPFNFSTFSFLFYTEYNDLINKFKKYYNLKLNKFCFFILNNIIKIIIFSIFFCSFFNNFFFFTFTIGNFNSVIPLNISKFILSKKKNVKYDVYFSKKNISKITFYNKNRYLIGINMSINEIKEDFSFFNINTINQNKYKLTNEYFSFYEYQNAIKDIYFNFYLISEETNLVKLYFYKELYKTTNNNINPNKNKIKKRYCNNFFNTHIFYNFIIIWYLIRNTYIVNINKDINKFNFLLEYIYTLFYLKATNNKYYNYINHINNINLYKKITYNKLKKEISLIKLKNKYNELKKEISLINLNKTIIKYKIKFSLNIVSNNIYLFQIFNYLLNIAFKRRLVYIRLHVFKFKFISNIKSKLNKLIINILNFFLLFLYHIYINIIYLLKYLIKYIYLESNKTNKNILKINFEKILNYNFNEQNVNIISTFKINSLVNLFLKTNSVLNKNITFCKKKFPYKINIKNKYNKLLYQYFNNILFTQNIKINEYLKQEILKILKKKEYYNLKNSNFSKTDIFFNLYLNFNKFNLRIKETYLLSETLESFNEKSNKTNQIDFNIKCCEDSNKRYKNYFKLKYQAIFIIIKQYFKYNYLKNYRYLYFKITNFIKFNNLLYYLYIILIYIKINFFELIYLNFINRIININKIFKYFETYYIIIIKIIYIYIIKTSFEIKKYLNCQFKNIIKIFLFKYSVDQIDNFLNDLNFIKFIKLIILLSKINKNNNSLLVNVNQFSFIKNKFNLHPIKKDIIEIVKHDQLNFIKYKLLFKIFYIYIFIFIILKFVKLILKYINLLKFEYKINLLLMTKKYSIDLYVKFCKYGYLEACVKHTISLYNNIFFIFINEVFNLISEIRKYIIKFFIFDILFTFLEINKVKTPYYYKLNLKNIYINIKLKYKEYLLFYTESNLKNWYKSFIYDFYYLRNSISKELFTSFSRDLTEYFYKRINKNINHEYTYIKDNIYTKNIFKKNETQFDLESWINTNDFIFDEERQFLIQFINMFLNIKKEQKISKYVFNNISIKNYENFFEYGYLYLIYFLDMLRINIKETNIINIKEKNRLFITNYQKITEYLFLKKNRYKIIKKPYLFSLTMIPSSSKGILLVGKSEDVFVLKEKLIKDYADLPFIILNPLNKELSDYEIAKYSYDESDLLFVDKFDINNNNISTNQIKKMFKKIYNTDKNTFELEKIKILDQLMPKRKTSIYDVFNIVTQFKLIESISSCIIFIPNIHLCHYNLKFKQFYELSNLISKINKNNLILAYTNKPQEVDPILIGYDKLSKCILLKKPTIEIKKKYIFKLLKTKGFYIEKKELLHEHLNIKNIRDLYILTNQTLSLSLTQNKYVINYKIINQFIFYFFRFNQFIKKRYKVPIRIVFYQIGRFFLQIRLNSLIIDPISVYLIDSKTNKYPLYKNYYELGTNIKRVTVIIYLLICLSGLIAYKIFKTSEMKNLTHEYFNHDLRLTNNLLFLEKVFYFDYFRLINFIDKLIQNEKEILKINKYNLIKSNILELDFSVINAYNYENDILPTNNLSNKKFKFLLNRLVEKNKLKNKDIYIPYETFLYVMYEDFRFADQLRIFVSNILKPLLDKNFIFNTKSDSYKNYKYKKKHNISLRIHYEAIEYLTKIFYKNSKIIHKLFKKLIKEEFIWPNNFQDFI